MKKLHQSLCRIKGNRQPRFMMKLVIKQCVYVSDYLAVKDSKI